MVLALRNKITARQFAQILFVALALTLCFVALASPHAHAFAQVFPTPDPGNAIDPVDATNGGVYAISALGLLPVIVVFIGLIIAGVLWRMVRPRGR